MDPVRRPSPFLEQVRAAIRVRHYSIRTEESYLFWVRRFILFHGKRHPRELGESQVGEFLTHLAVDRKVSASTQNQALNALVFLYKAVLERPLGEVGGVVRARQPQRLPVVLHVREVKALLRHLEGSHWLAACLMYGSGLRLMEALRLRVKDLDFEHRAIMLRDGKGQKDRVVTLADELIVSLQRHLEGVRLIHTKDLVDGFGEVYLPDVLERKYPRAGRQWGWQYVFPAGKRSIDPRSSKERRHHIDESTVQNRQSGGAQGRYRQTSRLPYPEPCVRDAPLGAGDGYPHGAGAAWAQGRSNHTDLHARDPAGGIGGPEPVGSGVGGS